MTTRHQTWNIVNEQPLSVLETNSREPLDNLFTILDSKLDFPFRLSLSGYVLTVHESELQILKSDGAEGTENSFKIATSPIQGQYKTLVESTIDFSTGVVTGDFAATPFCPTMTSGEFVWVGFEVKTDGKINLNWGNPAATANAASFPTFTSGTAINLILLQDNGSGGTWNFLASNPEDVIIFKGSGGGGGGGGTDFVPIYKSSSEYRVQSSQSRIVKLNRKYFYSTSDLDISFNLSSDTTRYICFDTSKTEGAIDSTYIVESTLDPSHVSFPQHLIVLGHYVVTGGAVTQTSIFSESTRENNNIIGDLVPSYISTTQYRIQNTEGKKIKLLNKYFYLDSDLIPSFESSATGTWYICIDTANTEGQILLGYIVETQIAPTSGAFDPDFIAIGEYSVASVGTVASASFIPYSLIGAQSTSDSEQFVPLYVNTSTFLIRSTNNRSVLVNNKYFYSTSDITQSFEVSASGKWYICLDSSLASGAVSSSYFVMTQIDPTSNLFNPYYVILGDYTVSGGSVAVATFNKYSTREMISWVYGIPNIKRKAEQQVTTGTKTLTHGFDASPDLVTYKYWDASASKFYYYSRTDIEISCDTLIITYKIPATDPVIVFDTDDYFEIEAFYYNYTTSGGFASPKTDSTTDWYVTTPLATIAHNLFAKPKNVTFEWYDTGIYYVEDGNQYINKTAGGITDSSVTFDWTSLPVLSANKKFRINFNLSKLSAGAFTASKTESGTVVTSGLSSTAISPDVILRSTDTNIANIVNAAGNNISVYVFESIVVSSEQTITATGISWNMLPGIYIESSTDGLASILKFSGADYTIENMTLVSKGNITSGLKLNADGIVKNITVKQDSIGETLVNAVEVVTGSITTVIGRAKAVTGNITNKYSDPDMNSEIMIS